MTKCLSLDSNKSSVIPPLKHCLVTTVPSCSSGRPLKGVRANKCCIYTHVPWRISQLWEWRRTHMSRWLRSLCFWMPFIGITKICWNVSHDLPVQWAHQVKNKLRILALWYFPASNHAAWEQDEGLRKQTDPGRKHTPTAFLLALPGCSINSAATASTQHAKHSKCVRLSVAGLILIWSSRLWI